MNWTLHLHDEPLAVVATDEPLPETGPIRAELVTAKGRTLVLPYEAAAGLETVEGPFRALEVRGPLEFSLTGVLAELLNPLARAEISVFTLSTFDTDWILVPAEHAEAARSALTAEGHTVHTEEFA